MSAKSMHIDVNTSQSMYIVIFADLAVLFIIAIFTESMVNHIFKEDVLKTFTALKFFFSKKKWQWNNFWFKLFSLNTVHIQN